MLNGKDPETFEEEVKKQFATEQPVQMKLLIVADKLLIDLMHHLLLTYILIKNAGS